MKKPTKKAAQKAPQLPDSQYQIDISNYPQHQQVEEENQDYFGNSQSRNNNGGGNGAPQREYEMTEQELQINNNFQSTHTREEVNGTQYSSRSDQPLRIEDKKVPGGANQNQVDGSTGSNNNNNMNNLDLKGSNQQTQNIDLLQTPGRESESMRQNGTQDTSQPSITGSQIYINNNRVHEMNPIDENAEYKGGENNRQHGQYHEINLNNQSIETLHHHDNQGADVENQVPAHLLPMSPKVTRKSYDVDSEENRNYNPDLETLIPIANCCEKMSQNCHLIGDQFNQCTQKVDNVFRRMLKACQGEIRCTSAFIFLFFFFVMVCLIYVLITLDSVDKSAPPSFDDLKKYVSSKLVAGSVIFTFYGIFFLQIENAVIIILIGLFQAVPALFIFLYYYYQAVVYQTNNGIIQSPDYFIAIYVFGLYFFWLAAFVIKQDMRNHFSKDAQNFFLMIWCVLAGALMIGYTVYSASTTNDLNFNWGRDLVNVIAGPYIILLCLGWVYLHFRYFQPLVIQTEEEKPKTNQANGNGEGASDKQSVVGSESVRQGLLSQEGGDRKKIIGNEDKSPSDVTPPGSKQGERDTTVLQSQDTVVLENGDVVEQQQVKVLLKGGIQKPVWRDYMQNYIVIFSSCVLGGALISLTTLSVLYVSHSLSLGETNSMYNEQAFYMSLFMSVCVPFFVLMTTGLVHAKVDQKKKLILIPILGALIPVLFFMPFSMIVDEYKIIRPIKLFFSFGPSVIAIYWITLIWIQINQWRVSMIINSYLCLFFIIPLLYILPLRGVNTYDDQQKEQDDVAYGFELGLIIIGLALLVFLIFFDLILIIYNNIKNKQEAMEEDEFTRSERFELSEIFKYDLEDFGLWGNSFGYIFTMTILIFMYYNQPVWIQPEQSGTLIGMQVVIFFLFLWCLIILLLQIIPEKQKAAVSFSEQITKLIEEKHERDILIDRQRKVKRAIIHFGFITAPIFLAILLIIYWNDEEMRAELLTVLIGLMCCSLVFVAFFEIKQNFDNYSKTAVPALVVFCWIFLYLPFSGIIPSSIFYLSVNDEGYVTYERLVAAVTALLLLIGLLLICVLIHLYYQRMDFEKRFRFIAARVIRQLAKVHVKSDYHVIELAYQSYVTLGEDSSKEAMQLHGKPVFWTQISVYNPDEQFSKMVIDKYAYDKLKDRQKQPVTCMEKFTSLVFLICCCYRDGNSKKKSQVGPDDENLHLLAGNDEDGDVDDAMQKMMDQALQDNIKKQNDEEEIEEEEDSFMKNYLLHNQRRYYDGRFLEPLRRYDLPQNLQISKPRQTQFLKEVFDIFAQGSQNQYPVPWIDYVMFKELMVLSGIIPCRQIPDFKVDELYGKFTAFDKIANTNPITEERFHLILTKVAVLQYPFDPQEDALGKLVQLWMFPFLLWYLSPIQILYPHEWDYVLFLIKFYGLEDVYSDYLGIDGKFKRELEKYLGIQKMRGGVMNPDILQDQDNNIWTCKRLMEAIKNCCKTFCENLLYFIKSFCLLESDQRNSGPDAVQREVQVNYLRTLPIANKRRKRYNHKPSPEWPEIVDIMVDEMVAQEREFMRTKDMEFMNQRIKNSVTNYLAILFKIIQFYLLGSLAFRPEINWGFSQTTIDGLNFFNTKISTLLYSDWIYTTLGAVLAFVLFSYLGVLRIRNNFYGICEAKQEKNYCTWDFIEIQLYHFITMVMSFPIFQTCIDAFACDYSIKPTTMYMDVNTECFIMPHASYLAIAIICLLIFYPMCSFLYPNMQFQNRALDLRYDPTYLVVAVQIKLIVAATGSFFAHKDIVMYQSFICAAVLFGFGMLSRKMQPCIVQKIVPLEMGGFFLAGWMHVGAIVTQMSNPDNGLITLIVGEVVILLICLGLFRIYHNRQARMKKTKIVTILGENGQEKQVEQAAQSDDQEDEEEEAEQRRQQEKQESLEFKLYKQMIQQNYFQDIAEIHERQDEELEKQNQKSIMEEKLKSSDHLNPNQNKEKLQSY